MSKKIAKTLSLFALAFMAGSLAVPAIAFSSSAPSFTEVRADEENCVNFETSTAEAGGSNIVTVKLIVRDAADKDVTIYYKTNSGTAIEGIDFTAVNNSITLRTDAQGKAEYTVSIKCLNDANNREGLRVHDSVNGMIYGRYFTLQITKVEGSAIGTRSICKCYTSYDYQVEATTGLTQEATGRKLAYLNDLKEMLYQYHSGKGDIDGKETWKTWNAGVSFNNDTTKRWVNAFIKRNMATAYGTHLASNIDDATYQSDTDIHCLMGNQQFINSYSRDKNCPGLSLYYQVDPDMKGGYRLDGRAMTIISEGGNPTSDSDARVHVTEVKKREGAKRIYWYQDREAWFASSGTFYDTTFYKTEPYEGILNLGCAFYNGNKYQDREVKNVWMMMKLVDEVAPTLKSQYLQYVQETGALRFYLRFSEPVYTTIPDTSFFSVTINGFKGTKYDANFIGGNYSDTLVYEIPAGTVKNVNIESATYLVPEDIYDMAYNLSENKVISNNKIAETYYTKEQSASVIGGNIDLSRPNISVSPAPTISPNNVYNVILSTSGSGDKATFKNGTVYYSWSKEEIIPEDKKKDPTFYKYTHVLTSEERGSFPITLAKSESEGIDSGEYYLHVLVVPDYAASSSEYFYSLFGKYRLDGDNPILDLAVDPNTMTTKFYKLKVGKKALDTENKTITYHATYKDKEGNKVTKDLTILENGSVPTSLNKLVSIDAISDPSNIIYTFKSNIDTTTAETTPLDPLITLIMGEGTRLEAEISFTVTDFAGNRSSTSGYKTIYDTAELFTLEVSAPPSFVPDTSGTSSVPVYDISTAPGDAGLTFTVTDDGAKASIADGAIFSVTVNGGKVFTAAPLSYSVTLTGLGSNYYEAVGRISGEVASVPINKVAAVERFYLTNGYNDDTPNKIASQGNLVLSNHVYQIPDAYFHFFDTATTTVISHPYGATYNESTNRYEGGSSSPTFSGLVEAKRYIKFQEYQDLYLISITDGIASFLNSGSGSTIYVKAEGENKVAQTGQLWIRYKRANWMSNSGPSGWAYYYYGTGKVADGINTSSLSANLNAAMDAVVNRIVNAGVDTYLVQEDNLNQNTGAPYLGVSQMHVEKETITATKSGNVFIADPSYEGDVNLYQNTVKVENVDYPLATNMVLTIDDTTSLYYLYTETSEWKPIPAKDGQTLKNALEGLPSGIYTIREYAQGGIGQFSVYMDKTLPHVTAIINKGLPDEAHIPLTGEDSTVPCKSLMLEAMSNEVDSLAYVAIYSYPNRVLKKVLYGDEVDNYALPEGNYYLQIGDRSGNVVTFAVLTSESEIDITVEENQSKTGVYVKVTNREESEIYSYEVYLNETLIDNEFAPTKFYRDPGNYLIKITDIYGRKVQRAILHSSPLPEVTWYYLNDYEGYSGYDPLHPVRMIVVEDETSPRTTNVYASTLLRLAFTSNYGDSEIGFEVLDYPSTDYTYNATTHILSFNSLGSWRLRVWYEDAPENDHIYICTIDNTAPECTGSFIGTSFGPYVEREGEDETSKVIVTSSFDSIDFSKYEVGDVITLDTLVYADYGTSSLTFASGMVISGNRIVVHVADPSGIRSCTVTRNGQPVQIKLDDNNDLKINDYGSYVITTIDNLGNTSQFAFENVSNSVASAAVDGVSIEENANIYGHQDVIMTGFYAGTTDILVKVGDKSYTYEFNYDGKTLTYGHYIVAEEKYEDTQGIIQTVRSSQFQQATGFALYANQDTTKRNTWYPVLTTEDYAISAMIDDLANVRFKVAPLAKEISVEMRLSLTSNILPGRFMATLSTEFPALNLLTGGKPVEQNPDLSYIYIVDDLTIDKTADFSKITKIEVAFGPTPNFEKYETIFENGQFVVDFVGSEDGFYQIIATNVYNNKTSYLISKILSFASVVNVTTLDGVVVSYPDNDQPIYSDHFITLIVYSDSVVFQVTFGETTATTTGIKDKGTTILELTREGQFAVRVLGDNGIFEDFVFEIKNDASFVYEESWITGFNPEALLADQGYTNTLCSIDVSDEDIVFVGLTFNDGEYQRLYDCLTPKKVDDPELLKNVIGRYGAGRYVIDFRNKYGDLVKKVVNYSDIPSLKLSRIVTSNSQVTQPYDLDLAIEKDFLSNYVLIFATESQNYIFKINDQEYRLDEPKSIEFTNISGNGYFEYQVEYLDEYGNHIKFKAILNREDISIDTSAMKTISSGTNIYTKDDVCIRFNEEYSATVNIDEADAIPYTSGFTFYGDGTYRFVVEDIAGNQNVYTVIHKSMNHYTLTYGEKEEAVIFGGVVNDGTVTFTPTDGSKLAHVFRDGEEQVDYLSNKFTNTGHWELLIEDGFGNQSYEEFYIINNELCRFEYNAPYGYLITEVWTVSSDGSRKLMPVAVSGHIALEQNGTYLLVLSDSETTSTFNFSVSINDAPPTATLVGAENGGVTARDVTLSGLKTGDVVRIYKDGELISTTTISLSNSMTPITTGGKYRIVITNIQGKETEYSFTRKSITNAAGSAFIIVTCALMIAGIGVCLLHHTRLKTDN